MPRPFFTLVCGSDVSGQSDRVCEHRRYQTKDTVTGFNFVIPTFKAVNGGAIHIQDIKIANAADWTDNIQVLDEDGAGVAAYFSGERTGAATAANSEASAPRHQIYGDPVIVGALERGDFTAVLSREGDRLLAIFAQSGKLMCARGADPRRLPQAQADSFAAYAATELTAEQDVQLIDGDSREVKELKQIVNGMRAEIREYLANGNGTPRTFWRRLNERTTQEMQIYERTRRELEKETSEEVWEQKNDALRRLGLRTIPNPGE